METESRVAVTVLWSIRREIRKKLNKVLHQYGQYRRADGDSYHKRNVLSAS